MREVNNLEDACEHIRELHEYCKERSLELDSCGDCQTPWVTCHKCGVEMIYANLGGERVESKRVVKPEPLVPF